MKTILFALTLALALALSPAPRCTVWVEPDEGEAFQQGYYAGTIVAYNHRALTAPSPARAAGSSIWTTVCASASISQRRRCES